ncbi:hypothetical protein GCM10009569_29970 [Arthrobacter russicus]
MPSQTLRMSAADKPRVRRKSCAAVRSAVAGLYRRFRAERGGGDLGDAAAEVLSVLCKSGPQTLKDLSELQRVTPASMSQVVNRLTSAGYAERGGDPRDGRKVIFTATAQGEELFLADRARRHAWFDANLVGLSAADRAALARAAEIMERIAVSPNPGL